MKFNKLTTAVFVALIIVYTFASTANAQWQRQKVETTASLRGLAVVDQNVIWASGANGTFLRTTDGGKSWKTGKVPNAEKLDFRDVEAFDANTAYLLSIGAGETSRIYKTTDGGENWTLQFANTDPKVFLDAFAFWDANNGIAMGDPVDGRYFLLETTDGGRNWKPIDTSKMPAALRDEAAFAASGTCIVANGKSDVYIVTGGQAARVFRSSDKGKSWTVSETPIVNGASGAGIFSIAFDAQNRAAIVGGNYEKPNEAANNLAFSSNAGKSWTLGKGLNGYRSGIWFVDRNTLIAVGSTGSDLSRDAGRTWTNLDKNNYNAVAAAGKNAIWAIGANGVVARLSPELQIKRFPNRRRSPRRRLR